MRIVYRAFSIAIMVVLLLGSKGVYGQGGATGAISGAVVDTSGGSGAGAEGQGLDTRPEALVRKGSTNADGLFVGTLLPPGSTVLLVNIWRFHTANAIGV